MGNLRSAVAVLILAAAADGFLAPGARGGARAARTRASLASGGAGAGPAPDQPPSDRNATDLARSFYENVKRRGKEGASSPAITEEKDIYRALRERTGFGVEEEFARVRQERIEGKNATSSSMDASAELLKATLRAKDGEGGLGIDESTGYANSPGPTLTPGEVVMSILQATKRNDEPYKDHGIEVLLRFTSGASSAVDAEIEFARYCDFIPDSEYDILLKWDTVRFRPLEERGKNAFQKVQLKSAAPGAEWVTVKFKLSERKTFLGDVWLVDSFIVSTRT